MNCEECARRERSGLRNRALRRELEELQQHADKTFFELCRIEAARGILAESALEEIWASGLVKCGPDDYQKIVERCLAALREYNDYRTGLVPAATLCA